MVQTTTNTSYNYNGTTYILNPLQQEVEKKITSLPRKNLHYVVANQSYKHRNLTLKQLKKLIRRSLVNYQREIEPEYNPIRDAPLVKCICVFETSKDLNQTQMNSTVSQHIQLCLHFHIFLSCSDSCTNVNFSHVDREIQHQLVRMRGKKKCIYKYNFVRTTELEDLFTKYHVKQLSNVPSREMIYTNF
jgi:hypothetical protein